MSGQPAISVLTTSGESVSVPLTELAHANWQFFCRRPDDAIDLIQRACAQYFAVSVQALRGPCRKAHLVHARHVAIALARELTTYSLPEIARRFGGRDHTTALYAVHKIKALAETDPMMSADLELLRAAISGATA